MSFAKLIDSQLWQPRKRGKEMSDKIKITLSHTQRENKMRLLTFDSQHSIMTCDVGLRF